MMKLAEIIKIYNGLLKLKDVRFTPVVTMRIFKLLKEVEEKFYKPYNDTRTELIKRHGEKQKDGSTAIVSKIEIFNKEINELLEVENKFKIKKIKLADFKFLTKNDEYIDYPFTTEELFMLENVIDI